MIQEIKKSGYQQRIEDNMNHMKSSLSEWSSLEIKGYTESEGHLCPEFDFTKTKDYKHADSLYKGDGLNAVCELCGHNIKMVYWIKNDEKKLLLSVGSECVTHFSEKSGVQLTKEIKEKLNLEYIKTVLDFISNYNKKFFHKIYIGYSRYEYKYDFNAPNLREFVILKKSVEHINLNSKFSEISKPAAITRWINKNKTAADSLMRETILN